jgi:AcrR family transcriptional regulator
MAKSAVEHRVDGRRARGDRSRALILERAIEIAGVEGLEGLTFGRLAAEAGIGKGNLSVLFGDKESLQVATMDADAKQMVKTVIEPALKKDSAFSRVKALFDGWFTWVKARSEAGGCLMFASVHEYRSRPGTLHAHAVESFSAWRNLVTQQLRAAVAEGDVRADVDVERAIFTLLSYQNMAHLASTIHDRSMFAQARKLTREHLDSLT